MSEQPKETLTFAAAKLPPVPDSEVYDLVQPIIRHIHDVFTNQDSARTEWVLNWFANQIQRPHLKHRVAVVVNGVDGCGKGILAVFYRDKVLGKENSYQTADVMYATLSKHANGAAGRVFVQVDQELKFASKQYKRLHSLITGTTLQYQPKYVKRMEVENMVNLFITSGKTFTIEPDGPFALFQCSRMYVRDHVYFNKLALHLERGEVARAWYQFLMGRDLSDFHTGLLPPQEEPGQ